jgi:uncharacterized protein (DUF2235 family)
MTKDIIFCADGTWNHPDETDAGQPSPTNVWKFFKALRTTATQLPYYDDGVGADGTPIDRLLGGAIGDGLFQKIKDGYTYLAHNYDDGDRIFLFGFSRGAYTVRSLAGMVAICGLPLAAKFSDAATDDAFDAYRTTSGRQPKLDRLAAAYDNRNVEIAALGVWDTVGAMGIPLGLFDGLNEAFYGFLSLSLHQDVKAGFHALSIDERRNEFVPTLWDPPTAAGQVIDQVWFAGVHADVGGGYADCGLSNITLGWMMNKVRATGLQFDPDVLQSYTALDPKHALDAMHDSWSLAWGFPRARTIAAGSVIANSVAIRNQHDPSYHPPNLPASFPDPNSGMRVEHVLAVP